MKQEDIFVEVISEASREDFSKGEVPCNVEVGTFMYPHILDDPGVSEKAKAFGENLGKQPIRVGMHGPTFDLCYESRDEKIRRVARDRILQAIDIAELLGAEFLVSHSTYNPIVASQKYRDEWVPRSVDFWNEMTEKASEKKIRIVLENFWDKRPELMKQVVSEVNSPFFKFCFDVGHFNIFSEVSIEEWVENWGEDLSHLHLHNNFGEFDEHNGFQDGTFDFVPFFNALKKNKLEPTMTVEVRHRKDLEPSQKILESLL